MQTVFVLTEKGNIFRTKDMGRSWKKQILCAITAAFAANPCFAYRSKTQTNVKISSMVMSDSNPANVRFCVCASL